jgi:hypothetical protein
LGESFFLSKIIATMVGGIISWGITKLPKRWIKKLQIRANNSCVKKLQISFDNLVYIRIIVYICKKNVVMEKKTIKKWVYIILLFLFVKILYDIISNPTESINSWKRGVEYVLRK